jgi:hypothetical protein
MQYEYITFSFSPNNDNLIFVNGINIIIISIIRIALMLSLFDRVFFFFLSFHFLFCSYFVIGR